MNGINIFIQLPSLGGEEKKSKLKDALKEKKKAKRFGVLMKKMEDIKTTMPNVSGSGGG